MRQALNTLLAAAIVFGSACGESGSAAPLAPAASASQPTASASAPSLFDDDPGSSPGPAQPPVTRSRRATVNVDAIGLGSPAATPRVLLNLFRDAEYVAVLDRVQRTGISTSWIGTIDGVAGSEVVLAMSGGVFAATVSLPNAYFSVLPADGGRYLIAQIDRAGMLPPD